MSRRSTRTSSPGCGCWRWSRWRMPAPAFWWCWRAIWRARSRIEAAAVTGAPVDPFARTLIYYFALAPLILVTRFRGDLRQVRPVRHSAAAGPVRSRDCRRRRRRHHAASSAHPEHRLVQPADRAGGADGGRRVLLLPSLFAVDLKIAQPADDIAQFFTDNFERRTGRKLEVVAGDPRLASLVAVASRKPAAACLMRRARPAATGHARRRRRKRARSCCGARPTVPARRRRRSRRNFPSIVPEVPRAFDRAAAGPRAAAARRLGRGAAADGDAGAAIIARFTIAAELVLQNCRKSDANSGAVLDGDAIHGRHDRLRSILALAMSLSRSNARWRKRAPPLAADAEPPAHVVRFLRARFRRCANADDPGRLVISDGR